MRQLTDFRYFLAITKAGSIRKAADTLAITSTALNRRMLALEDELGDKLFERYASGVKLTAAGELFSHHVQGQLSALERVKSQISDLSGVRRGHINIACSQAMLTSFLPGEIAAYREKYPAVTFGVYLRDREAAEHALISDEVDLALVFDPVFMSDIQVICDKEQTLYVILAKDHPLAAKDELRLGEVLNYPLALPSLKYGVRRLLEFKAGRSMLNITPTIESDSFEYLRNHCTREGTLTFQIEIGLPRILEEIGLVARPLSQKDMTAGSIYLAQKRGRPLHVAAAKFAEQINAKLLRGD